VVDRFVFYNQSAFDGHDASADSSDDAAIAVDKSALLPGQTSAFDNVTTYSKGINGVMVDVAGLPSDPSADDFEFFVGTQGNSDSWRPAPTPLSIARRANAGVGQSDRLTFTWADHAIVNTWLRITVKATANTGLAAPDVFYFGSLPGETGDQPVAVVTPSDWRRTRGAQTGAATVTNVFDFNRDQRSNAIDLVIVRSALRKSLPPLTPMIAPTGPSFFVPAETQGQTQFTLQPIESTLPNRLVPVSFGVPFPKGFIPSADLSRVRLLDAAGAEEAASVQLLTPWRDIASGTDLPSARSVLVQTYVSFPDADGDGHADPITATVEWGRAARTLASPAPFDPRDAWVLYDNIAAPAGTDFKAADNVYEPPAYAVFTPDWYGKALLKTRLLPFESDPAFTAYDAAYHNFSPTAINNVDPRVTAANLIHYADGVSEEPWLFDRAMALYEYAFRSGDITYLRQAHRNAQYYANHIDADGYFDLKGADLKYVCAESVDADFWLTGDPRLPAVQRRMVHAADINFNPVYTPGHFWTERHAAFELLAYVNGFEMLGDPIMAQTARTTFGDYVNQQNNPPAGAENTGLLMHHSVDHIEGGDEYIASPWMTALLVDAVERYYVHSADPRVPTFVTRIAQGIDRIGESLYYTSQVDGVSHLVPYYLAGPGLTDGQHETDPWSDIDHAVDVSKIFALAYFFSRQAGTPNTEFAMRFSELQDSAEANFRYWTRPNGPTSGLPVFRLTPPREYNWWFRTTADRDFLMGPGAPATADTIAPAVTFTPNNLTTAGDARHTFTVIYFDNRAVDVTTIDSGDVRVRGPNGYDRLATLISVDAMTNGSPRIVLYGVDAPGGSWDSTDNGTYDLDLLPSQVSDCSGHFVPGKFLGRFTVLIA
jgi:hypothetical protein